MLSARGEAIDDYAVADTTKLIRIKELSRVSGVPTATISRAENGQPLSVKSAGKLCRALDEVFTDLFEVETNNIIGGRKL